MQEIVKLVLQVDELYLKKAKRGTRVELPMYDGYTIKKKSILRCFGKAVKKPYRNILMVLFLIIIIE